MNIGIADLGKVVECPKCGKTGRVGLEYSRAKGNRYVYLAVRHFEGGKARRCLIRRLSDAELRLIKKESAESFVSEDEVTKLRSEVERLRQENAQLRAQLEQLKPIEEWVMYAKHNSRTVGREESEALRLYYIKRKGYTPEQANVARGILEPLIERGLSGELSTIVWGSLPSLTH